MPLATRGGSAERVDPIAPETQRAEHASQGSRVSHAWGVVALIYYRFRYRFTCSY
jgi:hypothetical protein